MNRAYDLAHQLARAIKDSDEYKSFIEKKEALIKMKETKNGRRFSKTNLRITIGLYVWQGNF